MYRDFVYNNKSMKYRRRQLRNTPTKTESILWKKIRSSKLGHKFDRQYSIGGYVLDFYCPMKRVAIEIDGGIHQTRKEYDQYRDKWLKGTDIKVIHFADPEISGNIQTVIAKLIVELNSPS